MSKFETNNVAFHNGVTVTHKRRSKNPSFSSILLDAVYRSIDEDHNHNHNHHHHDYSYTTPTSPTASIQEPQQRDRNTETSKQRRNKIRSDSTLETVDLRRAIMIESWIDKHQQQQQQQPQPQQQQSQRKHFHLGDLFDQKIRIVRQKSVPNRTTRITSDNSTTDFSSSSSSSCFTNLTPRSSSRDQSSSRIFTKTKSRALKIYGDLKIKPKQQNAPISPGRRIASFLNSIFRNSGASPVRNSPEMKLNPATSNSTCSSASSFSRSCLSNKTSSTEKSTPAKSTPATKRSVRFYPVSVIVDEDSRPCGHKSLQKNENEEQKKLASPLMENAATDDDEGMKWRREKEIDALMMMIKTNCSNNKCHVSSFDEESDEEMEEDDDGESCASSDLFELENLSCIGVSRYYEELPVYGTTSLKNLTA